MLGWINGATWEEKYDFFRSMLGVLPPTEVKTLGNMANKMQRVCKRKIFGPTTGLTGTKQPKRQRNEPVPICEPVPSSSSQPVLKDEVRFRNTQNG